MYDIAIIGAGSGGLSVAAGAAQFGRSVVLFESGAMGGDCLNSGCVPSKALLAQAKLIQARRNAGEKIDAAAAFRAAQIHVRSVIASIAPHDSVERFEGLGVTVVQQHARFINRHCIEAGGKRYEARRIVIASGSRPAVPAIAGLASVPYLTNETIFDVPDLPQHLIILGGGPIGIELAQAFRRLGSEVTVVEAVKPLAREDDELARVVLHQLTHEGIRLMTQATVTNVAPDERGLRVSTDRGEDIIGSHLLIAAGRRPNIEKLGLEAAGVASTAKGITVDAAMRTSKRHIYAVGDVASGPQFTHAANQQASLVLRHVLFRLVGRFRPEILPRVTYSDPEIASVGNSETEARQELGEQVRVYRTHFAENDRARAEGRVEGMVKVVATSRGKILGVSIVGKDAGLLLDPWVLALEQGLNLRAMAEHVVAYPSRAEAGKRVALGSFAGLPQNRWVRYAIGIINKVL